MLKKKGPFKKQVNTMQYDQAFELNSVKEHFDKLEQQCQDISNEIKVNSSICKKQSQEISTNESIVVNDFSHNYREHFLTEIRELLRSFQNQQFQQFEENEELSNQVVTLLSEKDELIEQFQQYILKIQLQEQQVGYKFKTKKNQKHR